MSIRHTNYPLVSIVVPCYNAELTIESCLDSLLSQGFQRLEIICVNDGSKDKTADILDSYRLRYPEVIVVNQKKLRRLAGSFVWHSKGRGRLHYVSR